jgi:hypothetical protein
VVTLSQAGNGDRLAAPQATQSLEFTK